MTDQMRFDCLAVSGNNGIPYQNRFPLLPEIMREQGYETISSGKMHLNPIASDFNTPPDEPGEVKTMPYMGFEKIYSVEGEEDYFDSVPGHFRQCHEMKWETEGKPFNKNSKEDWQKNRALYYGMITLIDDSVGRLIESLKQQGITENTIIIFTSDHTGSMSYTHSTGYSKITETTYGKHRKLC
jgi:arylsulfatase A-like enzyme